jgi:hypothetical protein
LSVDRKTGVKIEVSCLGEDVGERSRLGRIGGLYRR